MSVLIKNSSVLLGCVLYFFLSNQAFGQLALKSDNGFVACGGDGAYLLTVIQASTGDFTKYKIEWGDGKTSEEKSFKTLNHTYTSDGAYTLKFYGETAAGWSEPVIYDISAENKLIRIATDGSSEGAVCRGQVMILKLTDLGNNSASTVYTVDYGDGSTGGPFTGKMERLELKHTYNKSTCDAGDKGFYVTITATNTCNESGLNPSYGPYPIIEMVELKMDLPKKECTGYEVNLSDITYASPSSCGLFPVRKQWTKNGEQVDNTYQYFDTPDVYTYVATATIADLDCGNDRVTKTIQIIQRVKAVATPETADICEGGQLTLKGSDSEGDEVAYNWRVIQGGAANVVFAPNAQAADPQVTFKKYGTYRLRLTVDNGCSSDEADVVIEVKKNPAILEFKPLEAICPGKTVQLKNYIKYDWTWSGNPHQPTWTVTGPAGGYNWKLGNTNSEYPAIEFTKPGTYTLNVELTGVGCGDESKLKASQSITIYDPEITGEITDSGKEICENEDVVFTNNMQGVHLVTNWEVLKQNGASADGAYTKTVAEDGKKVTFHFTQYGEYKVMAYLQAECRQDNRTFNIKVHRAPEVYFTEFPAVICPDVPFLPGDYVDFRGNGNDAGVTFAWEVTGAGTVLLEGENSRNPKITFPTYGDYLIRLKINNPTPCTSPSLEVSRTVSVSNPKMELEIKPEKTTVCVGEQVDFLNTSDIAVTPTYYWGVSPEGYRFVNEGGNTAKAPQLVFDRSGIYNITAVVNGVCRPDTRAYTITVQQDPEVTLDPLPAICPDEPLKLTEELVHYVWNDNWKSGAESTRRVVWKLLDKPSGALHTPLESLQWNEKYPVLDLKTPGEYTLQVEVKSDASCGGTKLTATQKVTVYDPELSIDVKPQVGGDVMQVMGQNTYQVVEGSPLTFVNNSQGVGLHCEWSVSPAENVVISDPLADAPSFTFHRFGSYKVRVDLVGTCKTDFREFTIVVKGVPKFDFAPIPNRCDHWEGMDIRDFLTCDSSGSTEILCEWKIEPGAGYEVTEGTTSDMFYKIRFNTAGNYTLTLNAQAEYGGVKTVSQKVNVLKSVVTAKAELSKNQGCVSDVFQVIALNRSEGDSLEYTWTVTPDQGYRLTEGTGQLVMDLQQAGDYQITLEARNICASDSKSYDVKSYDKPEVDVIGGSDLGRVCERDYLFKGSEHVGEIRTNNDNLTHVRWKVIPDGATWENYTMSTDERPDLSFQGGKNYVITGEFKNHCKDTVKIHYTLAVDEYVPVALMPDTVVCAHTEAFLLRAVPHGGVWSCADLQALKEQGDKHYYFNPYVDEYQEYDLSYERGNGQCLATASMKVKVNKLPVVDAGADLTACLNDEPIVLTGILPDDGEWRGTGVRDNRFYPGENGADTFRLEYWYTDGLTGCPNLDTINMTVYGLPDPSFAVSWQQCRGIDSLYIPDELGKGHRFTWNFSNGQVLVTEDAPASYSYPQHGLFQVQLKATSVVGCSDSSAWKQVKVLDPPPTASFELADTAGCGPFTTQAAIDPEHFAGEYYNLNYRWDYGNGKVSTALEPEPQTYQATLFDTTYLMKFKVYNVCGEQSDSIRVGAWSQAVANFAMNPEEEGCTPAEVLFMNKSTGSHNTYTWSFGDGETSAETDPVHVFTTNNNMSVFSIHLKAVNRCTPDGTDFERTLKVKPNTIVVGFTKSRKYLCAGDTVCFENNSVDRDPSAPLNYSWDFGDGQVAAVWDTCHQYENPGTYHIKLKVDNGCARREFHDSVLVHTLPVLRLEGDGPLCEDLELELAVDASEQLKNITWDFGDGTDPVNGSFKVKHAFEEPGMYEVKVVGEADQIPSCPGKTVKTIEVWSNPRVKIQPLDTMACPPLLYCPEITATSYDYFTWDYGDGTPLTSEMDHQYTNDTNFIQSYNITAYVENNHGCKEEHHGLIRVYNGPKAAWDKEISYGRPEKVRFINLSRDYSETIWYLPFGEEVHSPEDQMVTFDAEGVYPISLAVVNMYGCRDSIFQEYRSYEGGLYFPNSFIPHSTNPKVNRFNGIGVGLKEYKLEIFDMYGNKIWETRTLEGGMPSEGWDGRNRDGKLLPQGVYMWRAEAVFFSEDVWTGRNNRSGRPQTTQGTVLLLRK